MAATTPTPQTVPPKVETVIILDSPRLPPDARLRVFDTDFLVHSYLLKLHSSFFATFLDSADKTVAPPDAKFKYEWVTKVGDGTEDCVEIPEWYMVCAGAKAGDLRLDRFEGSKHQQTLSFKRILLSMYSQPWDLDECSEEGSYAEDLKLLVALARYYGTLPIMSNWFQLVLSRSPCFVASISTAAKDYLPLAVELRNIDFFHDCMIYCLGSWDDPEYTRIKDEKLLKAAMHAYNALCAKILRVQVEIYSHMAKARHINVDTSDQRTIEAEFRYANGVFWNGGFSLPRFFNELLTISDESLYPFGPSILKTLVEPLGENNLRLRRDESIPNVSLKIGYFLCAEINDEDVPWDTTKTTW